jgi:hypothetical protein
VHVRSDSRPGVFATFDNPLVHVNVHVRRET